jgi:hypothetical protein
MASIADYIAAIRARGIAATQIDDTAMDAIIDEALYEFSRYKPIKTYGTFDTVAGQQIYTPTEMGEATMRTVTFCVWDPTAISSDTDSWAAALAQIGAGPYASDYNLPSQGLIDDIKRAEWAHRFGGTGKQQNTDGGDLWLTPLPDNSGDEVYIEFTKPHASVATIADADRTAWLDLVESMCCEYIASSMTAAASPSRVKTPEYEIEFAASIKHWRTKADQKRERFISHCNAGAAAVART